MTVSLAMGGAGLGTVWGQELALHMLADAGFGDVAVHDVPDDPLNALYVARRVSSSQRVGEWQPKGGNRP